MSTINTIKACVDCRMLIAYGETNPEWNEEQVAEHRAAIEQRFPTERLAYAGSEDKDTTFSWSACECCGSTLGGSRHVIAYF
jgi:hypothetical protein